MNSVDLREGDNRTTLKAMIERGEFVHAVVTDPPYGLVSIVKRFGKSSATDGTKTSDRIAKRADGFARVAAGGFMGKTWDGTAIERDPEFWKLIYDVLLPGGYVFAFSGSRTGHWQAVAMEQAGFIIHPMHGWCFGSGFPKAHAADKAIDKMLGKRGEIIPEGDPVKRMIPGADQHRNGSWIKDNGREYQPGQYVPGTPEAAQWEGYAYGTQTQKPALEPIHLAQKPFSEKTGAANLMKHGVGAVNIDGCRVGYQDEADQASAKPQGKATAKVGALAGKTQHDGERSEFAADNTKGRHPANLILDGSPEVVAMFPDSKGQRGDLKSHGNTRQSPNGIFGGMRPALDHPARKDSGSAARFFHQFPPDTDPLIYHPKAGKADRAGSKHPTVKPIALLQYLIRHITPPGGVVLDPFAGSGTTAEAARREGFDCILMEAEPEYCRDIRRRFGMSSIDDRVADLYLSALLSTNAGHDTEELL